MDAQDESLSSNSVGSSGTTASINESQLPAYEPESSPSKSEELDNKRNSSVNIMDNERDEKSVGIDNPCFDDDDDKKNELAETPKSSKAKNGAFLNSPAVIDTSMLTEVNLSQTDGKKDMAEAVNLELVNMKPYKGGEKENGIPVKKEVGGEGGSGYHDPYDEYFVPVNEHRKYMRGEKLYVTKDKRRTESKKKCICWTVGFAILAVAILIAILAGTGVILSGDDATGQNESSRQLTGGEVKAAGFGNVGVPKTPSPPLTTAAAVPPTTDMTPLFVPRVLEGEMVIDNMEFDPRLSDRNSPEFRALAAALEEELKNELFDQSTLKYGAADIYVKIIEFTKGSVVVKYRVGWVFKDGVRNPPDPLDRGSLTERLRTHVERRGGFLDTHHLATGSVRAANVMNSCQFSNGGCSHECVFDYTNLLNFACHCPDDMTLNSDGKTCGEPAAEPTAEPTPEPNAEPTAEPTAEPNAEPTAEPNAEPSPEPSAEPEPASEEPKSEPEPTTHDVKPSEEPKSEPEPTSEPEPQTEPPSAEPNTSEKPLDEMVHHHDHVTEMDHHDHADHHVTTTQKHFVEPVEVDTDYNDYIHVAPPAPQEFNATHDVEAAIDDKMAMHAETTPASEEKMIMHHVHEMATTVSNDDASATDVPEDKMIMHHVHIAPTTSREEASTTEPAEDKMIMHHVHIAPTTEASTTEGAQDKMNMHHIFIAPTTSKEEETSTEMVEEMKQDEAMKDFHVDEEHMMKIGENDEVHMTEKMMEHSTMNIADNGEVHMTERVMEHSIIPHEDREHTTAKTASENDVLHTTQRVKEFITETPDKKWESSEDPRMEATTHGHHDDLWAAMDGRNHGVEAGKDNGTEIANDVQDAVKNITKTESYWLGEHSYHETDNDTSLNSLGNDDYSDRYKHGKNETLKKRPRLDNDEMHVHNANEKNLKATTEKTIEVMTPSIRTVAPLEYATPDRGNSSEVHVNDLAGSSRQFPDDVPAVERTTAMEVDLPPTLATLLHRHFDDDKDLVAMSTERVEATTTEEEVATTVPEEVAKMDDEVKKDEEEMVKNEESSTKIPEEMMKKDEEVTKMPEEITKEDVTKMPEDMMKEEVTEVAVALMKNEETVTNTPEEMMKKEDVSKMPEQKMKTDEVTTLPAEVMKSGESVTNTPGSMMKEELTKMSDEMMESVTKLPEENVKMSEEEVKSTKSPEGLSLKEEVMPEEAVKTTESNKPAESTATHASDEVVTTESVMYVTDSEHTSERHDDSVFGDDVTGKKRVKDISVIPLKQDKKNGKKPSKKAEKSDRLGLAAGAEDEDPYNMFEDYDSLALNRDVEASTKQAQHIDSVTASSDDDLNRLTSAEVVRPLAAGLEPATATTTTTTTEAAPESDNDVVDAAIKPTTAVKTAPVLPGLETTFSKCATGQMQCVNGTSRDGAYCVSATAACDSVDDCTDGSDEAGCVERGCPGNFQCASGQCLKRHLVCNGIVDCDDASDEADCEKWQCQFDEFQCPSGRCIPVTWQCDGKADCANHTDEFNCQTSCGNNEYLCPEGWCIPATWRCNGKPECAGGDDEKLCDCSLEQHRCAAGGCVAGTAVCDGVDHCPDASDEWDCVRVQRDSARLQIRSADDTWRPVCSANWTSLWSDAACQALGYARSAFTEHVAGGGGAGAAALKQGAAPARGGRLAAALETVEQCDGGKLVEITCQDFTCGSHSLAGGVAARLVGGDGATTGQWPSVALLYHARHKTSCTASIISPKWLLASYNCLHQRDKELTPHNWIVFGGGSMFERDKPDTQIKEVRAIVAHPQAAYRGGLRYGNDVALVELATPVAFSQNVGAICLPERDIEPRQLCVTAGWGYTAPGEINFSQYLHYLPVPTIDLKECNSSRHYAGLIQADEVCAGYTDAEKTPCYNDEGAPLMCVNEAGVWELHAVLSYHSNCGRGFHPAIFSSVAAVRPWVEKTVGGRMERKAGGELR